MTRDVSYESAIWIENSSIISFTDHKLYPKKEGETKLFAEYQGKKIEIPVNVSDPTSDRPVSFKLDVMPIFMKGAATLDPAMVRPEDKIVSCYLFLVMTQKGITFA